MNLDDLLRPKSVGVISLNDKEFTDSGILKRFMKFTNRDSELHHGNDVSGFLSFHPSNPSTSQFGLGQFVVGAQQDVNHTMNSSLTGADPMSDALKNVVTDILRRTVNDIKSMLNRYVNVNGYSFVSLMPEIIFYIRFAELCDKMKKKNLPLCKAEVLPKEDRNCCLRDIYNLKLGIKSANGENLDIVTNDIDFNDDRRIYILTGPNRGGKTTITQAVGLAFLLAQNGIYVPATQMKFSPCDSILRIFLLMKTIPLTSADSVKKAKDLPKFSPRQAVTACFCSTKALQQPMLPRACTLPVMLSNQCDISAQGRFLIPICTIWLAILTR